MITVKVYKQSHYPVSAPKLKAAVKKTLQENGMVSDSFVSLAIVGDNKMQELVKKYYKKDLNSSHPVLTFPAQETKGEFAYPPKGKIDLGEIVVSYNEVVERAKKSGKLIDDIAVELAIHGALHLIGVHH